MKVLVLSRLKHDGKVFEVDTLCDMDNVEAEILIKDGIVKESTREDELVAEARLKARAEEAKAPVQSDDVVFTLDGDEYKKSKNGVGASYTKNGSRVPKPEFDAALAEFEADND